jgi:ribosomal protein S18 acetylase RimI-like enzyme
LATTGQTRALESNALEIQFIEVANECRRQGIGTEIVRELAATHPNRTLVAFSEQADEFWASLGWRRYDHPKEPRFHRPLFIQQ